MRIPSRVIQNAAGLAIFTCMRSGLWMSGSGGSGIIVARKADGTWSSPAAILLETENLGFLIGVDIYDCVLVINDLAALEIFMRPKLTLGQDVDMVPGPIMSISASARDTRWMPFESSCLTYLKSRGCFVNARLDGARLAERAAENEKFYGDPVSMMDILAGNVSRDEPEIRLLYEVAKAAEGRSDYDQMVLDQVSRQIVPGDALIESPKSSPVHPRPFGIPDADDPDPFGVHALELAGLEIREAGTRMRPASTQFEFHPSPTSPLYQRFNRQSVESAVSRSNRGSYMSSRTEATDRTKMTDAGTQTADDTNTNDTPQTSPAPSESVDGVRERRTSFDKSSSISAREAEEDVDYTKIDLSPLQRLREGHESLDGMPTGTTTAQQRDIGKSRRHLQANGAVDQGAMTDDASRASTHSRYTTGTTGTRGTRDTHDTTPAVQSDEKDNDADDEDSEVDVDLDDDEEPVVFEVAAAAPAPKPMAVRATGAGVVGGTAIQAKGALVTIPRRVPPPLPPRNPARRSGASAAGAAGAAELADLAAIPSPVRYAFDEEVDGKDGREKEDPNTVDATADAITEAILRRHHRHSSSVYTVRDDRARLAEAAQTPLPPELPRRKDGATAVGCSEESQRLSTVTVVDASGSAAGPAAVAASAADTATAAITATATATTTMTEKDVAGQVPGVVVAKSPAEAEAVQQKAVNGAELVKMESLESRTAITA